MGWGNCAKSDGRHALRKGYFGPSTDTLAKRQWQRRFGRQALPVMARFERPLAGRGQLTTDGQLRVVCRYSLGATRRQQCAIDVTAM